jgi:hypothetical protein
MVALLCEECIVWHPIRRLPLHALQGPTHLPLHPCGKGPNVALLQHFGEGSQSFFSAAKRKTLDSDSGMLHLLAKLDISPHTVLQPGQRVATHHRSHRCIKARGRRHYHWRRHVPPPTVFRYAWPTRVQDGLNLAERIWNWLHCSSCSWSSRRWLVIYGTNTPLCIATTAQASTGFSDLQ